MSASSNTCTSCAEKRCRAIVSRTSARKSRRKIDMADQETSVWAQLIALRNRQRALRAESPFVIRGAELPWETNPQGVMKWYLHPASERSCHKALIFSVQKIPPRSQSGKQHCQGGVVHYVAEGKGRTAINDVAYEWEAGDIVQLPLLPE